MSGQSSGEKTEPPTDKKLRDARKRGQVSKSQDVTTTVVTVSILAAIAAIIHPTLRAFEALFGQTFSGFSAAPDAAFAAITGEALQTLLAAVFPLAIVGILAVFVGCIGQVGFMLASEALKADLKKLNPFEGVKKIFSMKTLTEFIKSTLKLIVLSLLLYFIIWDALGPLIQLPLSSIEAVPSITSRMFLGLLIPMIAAYAIIAAGDYFLQRFLFLKEMRMTKDEVKREYKEQEGNPEMKGQRKSIHREMINDQTFAKTKSSTVLVTNPDHFAVGLLYDAGKTKLPLIHVKGVDHLAQRMIQIAEENDIPIVRNVRIARHLYQHCEVNDFIPNEMIAPVAEILKWVQNVQHKKSL